MRVLSKLTDEYFGETLREEEKTVSNLLQICMKNNKREKFVSTFKNWNDKNSYLFYKKDETFINSAETLEPTEALGRIINKNKMFEYGYVGLSKEILLATPDFYKKNTPNYDKMEDNIKQVIDKFFEEFYNHPEIVSTYLLFNKNKKEKCYPLDITIYDVNDVLGEKTAKKYSDCITVCYTSGFCDSFVDKEFSEQMWIIPGELESEFEKNGYEKYSGTTIKNMCPYKDAHWGVYLKK